MASSASCVAVPMAPGGARDTAYERVTSQFDASMIRWRQGQTLAATTSTSSAGQRCPFEVLYLPSCLSVSGSLCLPSCAHWASSSFAPSVGTKKRGIMNSVGLPDSALKAHCQKQMMTPSEARRMRWYTEVMNMLLCFGHFGSYAKMFMGLLTHAEVSEVTMPPLVKTAIANGSIRRRSSCDMRSSVACCAGGCSTPSGSSLVRMGSGPPSPALRIRAAQAEPHGDSISSHQIIPPVQSL